MAEAGSEKEGLVRLVRSATSALGGEVRDGGDGRQFTILPGIGLEALIDDFEAIVVFVFPRDVADDKGGCAADSPLNAGRAMAPQGLMTCDGAIAKAKDIFLSEAPLQRILRDRHLLGMQKTEYQELIKSALEDVVVKVARFSLKKFRSVDGDMQFWKVDATEGRLQELAQEYGYVMPYTADAYDAVDMVLPQAGWRELPAYGRYDMAHAGYYGAFSSVDAVRLVMTELMSYVNFDAMQSQEVLERWFPAAKFQEMKALTNDVVGYPFSSRKLALPQHGDADRIRSYLGEEVGAFFTFFGMMIRSLRWPVPIAAITLVIEYCRPLQVTLGDIRMLRVLYGIVVLVWGMWFATYVQHDFSMAHLRWGSGGQTHTRLKAPGYDPRRRGDPMQSVRSACGRLVTALFLVVVVMSTMWFGFFVHDPNLASILQTIVTFMFSAVWGRVAKWTVQLENKRMQSDFDRSLMMRLAFVKLFVFLFPILRLAFLYPIVEKVCTHDADVNVAAAWVAAKYYSAVANNLPELNISLSSPVFTEWVGYMRMQSLEMLADQFAHVRFSRSQHQEVCFRGCHPMRCEVIEGHLWCTNHCEYALRSYLRTLYVSHTLLTVAKIIFRILRVRSAAREELDIQKKQARCRDYSLLQYQEKCHIHAPYAYQSPGGSAVEDILEVILGFAVLMCFSAVCPLMAITGFVVLTFEYRCLVYRMTWITCRPFPRVSGGLGEVMIILEVIVFLAICVNAMLVVCVVRTTLDYLSPWNELAVTSASSAFLVFAKLLLKLALHEKPRDLVDAADQNDEFLEKLQFLRKAKRMASDA